MSSLFDLLPIDYHHHHPLSVEGMTVGVGGSCPLLEMLRPHLTEVFDDVMVVVSENEGLGASSGGGSSWGGASRRGLQLRVQGLVSIISTFTDPTGVTIIPTTITTTTTTTNNNNNDGTSSGGSGSGSGIGSSGSGSGNNLLRVVVVEWTASPVADLVADCSVGCVMQALSAPNVLRHSMMLANKPVPPKTNTTTTAATTTTTTTATISTPSTTPSSSSSIKHEASFAVASAVGDGKGGDDLDALLHEVASSSGLGTGTGMGTEEGEGGGTSLDDLLMSVGQEISLTLHDSAPPTSSSTSTTTTAAGSGAGLGSGLVSGSGAGEGNDGGNVWLWTKACRRKKCRHNGGQHPVRTDGDGGQMVVCDGGDDNDMGDMVTGNGSGSSGGSSGGGSSGSSGGSGSSSMLREGVLELARSGQWKPPSFFSFLPLSPSPPFPPTSLSYFSFSSYFSFPLIFLSPPSTHTIQHNNNTLSHPLPPLPLYDATQANWILAKVYHHPF